jgi:hypothetical protein
MPRVIRDRAAEHDLDGIWDYMALSPRRLLPSVPIGEAFEETLKDIPKEELKHLPPDVAEQHDHSIYGTPKKPA